MADGGKDCGIRNGYRPNNVFEYNERNRINSFVGEFQFEIDKLIMPGDEAIITVRFMDSDEIKKYLTVGRLWYIHEGGRHVGDGEILSLTNTNSG
ncbi:MAG: hypothetical protein IT236_17350 [Bacteroidia bacterium]|nr:hypothetical protein [Bacteroidia bacterium]